MKERAWGDGNVGCTATQEFQFFKIADILERHEPVNIFNAGETGLYYRGFPDRGYTYNDEILMGGKKAKKRVTTLMFSKKPNPCSGRGQIHIDLLYLNHDYTSKALHLGLAYWVESRS